MKTSVIYEPQGKAGEYNKFACNLYSGCDHGCVYCYAPNATRKTREEFSKPKPRDILGKLEKEALFLGREWNNPGIPILLCFTCDPYQKINILYGMAGKAIKILKKNDLNVAILTKGGKRAEVDFGLLTANDQFGVTLTCLENSDSLEWEPGAALPEERICSLEKAHSRGIKTWVSLEPVINPDTTLDIIRKTYQFVDLFKVGKMNYHPIAKTIDWAKFGREAVNLLESLGKEFYIKNDLRVYLS